jgi:hypothetical protein
MATNDVTNEITQLHNDGTPVEAATLLPSLAGFTHGELCDLVRILHGALVRAQADFTTLTEAVRVTTERAA